MFEIIAIVIFATFVGIAADWAIWSRFMMLFDRDTASREPNRLHWRDDLFPRALLLIAASAGMGIDYVSPSAILRYICILTFLSGLFWGILLAFLRIQQRK